MGVARRYDRFRDPEIEQEEETIPTLESEVIGESDLESETIDRLQEGLFEEGETESLDYEFELGEIGPRI